MTSIRIYVQPEKGKSLAFAAELDDETPWPEQINSALSDARAEVQKQTRFRPRRALAVIQGEKA